MERLNKTDLGGGDCGQKPLPNVESFKWGTQNKICCSHERNLEKNTNLPPKYLWETRVMSVIMYNLLHSHGFAVSREHLDKMAALLYKTRCTSHESSYKVAQCHSTSTVSLVLTNTLLNMPPSYSLIKRGRSSVTDVSVFVGCSAGGSHPDAKFSELFFSSAGVCSSCIPVTSSCMLVIQSACFPMAHRNLLPLAFIIKYPWLQRNAQLVITLPGSSLLPAALLICLSSFVNDPWMINFL